jgi:hypothetical protein
MLSNNVSAPTLSFGVCRSLLLLTVRWFGTGRVGCRGRRDKGPFPAFCCVDPVYPTAQPRKDGTPELLIHCRDRGSAIGHYWTGTPSPR